MAQTQPTVYKSSTATPTISSSSTDTEANRALKAIQSGAAKGQQLFGELPRLGEDQAVQDIISRFENLGRVRSGEELKIEREAATAAIDRQTQAASRRLEGLLSRQGIRGAQAGRQLGQVELEGLAQKRQLESGLFLGQKAEQRAAAEGALRDVANLTLGAKQFDIGQSQAERAAALSTGVAVAQLGAAERGATITGSLLGNALSPQAPYQSPLTSASGIGTQIGGPIGGLIGSKIGSTSIGQKASSIVSSLPVVGGK